MSAKSEKKFRKMHKKHLAKIADKDFKIYHKNVLKMVGRKNMIIKLLLVGIAVLVASNVFLILKVISYGY